MVVSILVLENEWLTAWVVDSDPLLRTCWVVTGGLHTLVDQRYKATAPACKEAMPSWTSNYPHNNYLHLEAGKVEEPMNKYPQLSERQG